VGPPAPLLRPLPLLSPRGRGREGREGSLRALGLQGRGMRRIEESPLQEGTGLGTPLPAALALDLAPRREERPHLPPHHPLLPGGPATTGNMSLTTGALAPVVTVVTDPGLTRGALLQTTTDRDRDLLTEVPLLLTTEGHHRHIRKGALLTTTNPRVTTRLTTTARPQGTQPQESPSTLLRGARAGPTTSTSLSTGGGGRSLSMSPGRGPTRT